MVADQGYIHITNAFAISHQLAKTLASQLMV